MKRRLSILVVLLCSVAYYSYSQTTAGSDQFGSSPHSASKQPPPSGIFDPLGLISPSEHGQLTTLGTGFSFTEGPAVDRHGNVFFTDQPNDRIYRWDAGTGEITLFLQGTGPPTGWLSTEMATSSRVLISMEKYGRSIRMEAMACW